MMILSIQATCAGVTSACPGACPCKLTTAPPTSCICPAVWSPVCGNDGNTYSNQCQVNHVICKYMPAPLPGLLCRGGLLWRGSLLGSVNPLQITRRQHENLHLFLINIHQDLNCIICIYQNLSICPPFIVPILLNNQNKPNPSENVEVCLPLVLLSNTTFL